MTILATTVQERISLPVRPQRGPGELGAPPGLSDIVAMLRRRTVLIVLTFILLSGLVVGGFALWWFVFPGFRAESLIECVSNIPERELDTEQERLRQDEHERFVRTQATLLKSPVILAEALKVNAVRETDWFRSVMRRKLEPLIELDEDLSASPIFGTNFLQVAIECRNPKDPAVLVNEVVNQWYHAVKKRTAEEFTADQLDAAQKEMENLEREIAEKRDRLKGIAQRLPPGAIQNSGENITAQNVKQVGEQVQELSLELSMLEQFREIYNDPQGVAVTAEDRALVEQDPQIIELGRLQLLLEQQRAAEEGVFGTGHAVLRTYDAQIAAAREKLNALRLERLRERQADNRHAANTAYANSRHSLFLAQERLRKAEAELQDQDRMLFDYKQLDEEILHLTEYRLKLDDHIKSLNRIKSQKMAININIAQPAIDPLERSAPSVAMLPLGMFFALLLSVGIALGLEVMDKSVRTSQDIVRHLDVALLGAIPHADDEEVAIKHVETAVRDHPQSLIAEAFRQVRTSLQFSAPAERQRVILITSPRAEDGKTTVACNLAIAVAQSGRRVLLVDANLRRPALHRAFPDIKAKGLSNILVGEGTLESYLVRTDLPLLDVLGSGPTPPTPGELVGGGHFRDFLQAAVGRYDQVILDAAPVLLASDSVVLSNTVDGVILVVRAKQNSRGVVRRSLTLLAEANAQVFGAVLNAAQVTRGGYFREQLRAYYEYQPEDAGSTTSLASRGS
jgi:capsular exopolysaccharide synthesis family protein